ncbi:MAG: DUF3566 domain-containing protein [Geodermatophilaceae bacterium]
MSDHTQSIPRVGGASSTPESGCPVLQRVRTDNVEPAHVGHPDQRPPAERQNDRSAGRPYQGPRSSRGPYRRRAAPSAGPSGAPAAVRPPVASGSATGSTTATTTGSRKAAGAQRGARGPRKARLQLRHVDTWSALKISLVLSVVMFFVWMVAVGILYGVLSGLSVFDEINKLWGQLGSEDGSTSELVTPGLIFGGAALIGAINIVLFTALATMATYIYNLSADLVGGLEVTLTERE